MASRQWQSVRRRRRPAAWALVGLAAGLIGVGCVGVAGALDTPLERQVVGGNTPVNEGAGDPADIQAHNSPAMARNPTEEANLVVASRIDLQRFSCAVHTSTDGGESWTDIDVPIPAGEEDKCYAPDVAFDAEGTLYVSYVTLAGSGNVPNAVWLVSSDDGGRTLSDPVRIGGDQWFQVRLTADPQTPDRLYLTWLQVDEVASLAIPQPGQPIHAAVSDNAGDTWSEPVQVNDEARERVVAPSPAMGPDGQWYVAYLDLRDDRLDYHGAHRGRGGPPYDGRWQLVVARSGDGGQSWTETQIGEVVPTERFLVFLPPFPAVAVDGDRVYVGFTDGRAADDPQDGADVWLWSSSDGAATFDEPVRVNDNPRGDGTRQYLPQVAVAPNGRLDVVYYDRRDDPDNLDTHASLQSSRDGGETFTDRLVLSDTAFDARIGFGAFRDLPEIGSRLGLISADARAWAVWTDTRAGTRVSGKQDLTVAEVAFAGGTAWPWAALVALRAAGVVAAVLGVVLLAGWLIGRRPVAGSEAPA